MIILPQKHDFLVLSIKIFEKICRKVESLNTLESSLLQAIILVIPYKKEEYKDGSVLCFATKYKKARWALPI